MRYPRFGAIEQAVHLRRTDNDDAIVVADQEVAGINRGAAALNRHVNAAAESLVRAVGNRATAINRDSRIPEFSDVTNRPINNYRSDASRFGHIGQDTAPDSRVEVATRVDHDRAAGPCFEDTVVKRRVVANHHLGRQRLGRKRGARHQRLDRGHHGRCTIEFVANNGTWYFAPRRKIGIRQTILYGFIYSERHPNLRFYSVRRILMEGSQLMVPRGDAMQAPTIRIRIDDHASGRVAWLSIDNQAKLNIVGTALINQLNQSLDLFFDDKTIRAVVLTGAGTDAFIGGADIREMVGFDSDAARNFITELHGLCRRLRDFPVPTIARINGYCLGAGMEIAASCDLRAASTDAKFGMPEVRVGIPSVIEAAVLPRLVGWGKARELVLTGDIIDAAQAQSIGFIERLVPAGELDAAIERWLDSILASGPCAIHDQKILIRRWEQLDLDSAIDIGIDAYANAYQTDEPRRMMQAFLDSKARDR